MEKSESVLAMEKNFKLDPIYPTSRLILYRFVTLIEQRGQSISSFCTLASVDPLPIIDLMTEENVTRFPIELLPALCSGLGISVRDFFDFPPYNEVEK